MGCLCNVIIIIIMISDDEFNFALDQYQEMYKRSIDDPAGFWSEIASEFHWKKKWDSEVYSENIDVSKGTVKIEVSSCLCFTA